jgi:hypothetical protein
MAPERKPFANVKPQFWQWLPSPPNRMNPDSDRGEAGLFRLIGFLRLLGLRPARFLSARGHPGIVFGCAAPRRHTGRLAAHPLRHVRQMLARGFAGASRHQHAGEAQEGPFEFQGVTIHAAVMPADCGNPDAQSRRRCDDAASRADFGRLSAERREQRQRIHLSLPRSIRDLTNDAFTPATCSRINISARHGSRAMMAS